MYNLRQKFFYLLSSCGITCPVFKIEEDSLCSLNLQRKDVEFIDNNTNNLYLINIKGEKGYFRECRLRKKFPDYIAESINLFYDKVGGHYNTVCMSICKKENLKRLFQMGTDYNPNSNLRISLKQNNPKIIGLDFGKYDTELKHLVNFLWSEVLSYRLNTKRNKYQVYNMLRSICEGKICKLLTKHNIIIDSKIVKCVIDDQVMIGTYQKQAKGINAGKVRSIISQKGFPFLCCQLSILNFLDALCYEKDHRPDNYNIEYVGEYPVIHVFDNDSSLAFFPSFSVKFSCFQNTSSLVDNDGFINRAHLDKEFGEAFLKLGVGKLYKETCKYLTISQSVALCVRFLKLKKAINKTILMRPDFLLKASDWTPSMIEDELRGSFGETYITLLKKWTDN
ncbi:hypothetical protein [Segatella copri]|uniref:Uncharacterized protein n=1 Tax=Segatella copri TaxID=165179 RepID=A0AAW5UI45_9BACT|nr:hypothetical protein [Segatella copri]MCW4136675.1 hypothetical protein [Segatella copri]MCW4142327.1 hypothetical protein [Segatella copri]MCW4166913.1 hypothetical protein [Segatella copri]